MQVLTAERKFTVVSALLIAALIFLIAGWGMENTLPGTWSSPCEIEEIIIPGDIIQIEDTMFFAGEDKINGFFSIRVFKSHDGCNWSEIESPASDHEIKSCSISLFRVPGGKLGITWEEEGPDNDKKPRSTFYWSTFDGNTWSEPKFLFPRDEPCALQDVIMLEDGSLLLLWDEPLAKYTKIEDRIVRGSGCRVTYRAFVGKDELIIDKVIEPENPSYCYTEGYSFVDDGKRIWYVFDYGSYEYSFYRSWSEDGKQWSEPEPFTISGPPSRQVLLTPQGEFGISCYDIFEGDFILFKSTDWENWSEEKIYETDEGIWEAVITEGTNGKMWGIFATRNGVFFIQPSQELKQKYQQNLIIASILRYIALVCIVLMILFLLSWMWKRS